MLDVQSIDTLRHYAKGVMARIAHHGADVSFAFPAVLGHVVAYGSRFDLFGDGTKNAGWFISAKTGQRYALSYGHPGIQIRLNSFRGPVIATIDNSTPPHQFEAIFKAL